MSATDLSTADVLRRAKQVLIERGWTQKGYSNAEGRVCLVGAVGVAVGGDPDHDAFMFFDEGDPYIEAIDAIHVVVGEDSGTVAEWNDEQESVAPILAAFDRAIALAESEAS